MAKEPEKRQEDKNSGGFKETLGHLKENEKMEQIYNFAKSNTQDTIAYVVMFLGIIILFFNSEWGGILVGGVSGFYFSSELLHFFRSINELVDSEGLIRSMILGGLLVGLLIAAPWIIIGAALGAGIKMLLNAVKK